MDITEIKAQTPRTLLGAIRYFKNSQIGIDFLAAIRWPDGVRCPTCGSDRVGWLAKYQRWSCSSRHPKRQFSVKIGTIFEDSPIGLDKWLPAMWLIVSCKNGISSYELARGIGVKQQTAWFMLARLRLALQRGTFDKPMGADGGEVEADETFIGGLARFMHKDKRAKKITGTGGSGKSIVAGLLDRQTRKVRVKHVANRDAKTLHAHVKANVEKGAQLMTDELASYTGLDKEYVHQFVNHAEEYVKGNVHTQGIDNFWALLKRMIKGTYVSVEPFHLFRYLDEEAFRFNERGNEDGDAGRFIEALSTVVGRRLTYKELIGNAAEPTIATAN
jgi:transposase-like protein